MLSLLRKFNPNHKPAGPGGGQFTSKETAAGMAAMETAPLHEEGREWIEDISAGTTANWKTEDYVSPPFPFDWHSAEILDKNLNGPTTVRRLYLDKLKTTQPYVEKSILRTYLRAGAAKPRYEMNEAGNDASLPRVARYQGEYYIIDGTHRLSARKFAGQLTAEVRLLDVIEKFNPNHDELGRFATGAWAGIPFRTEMGHQPGPGDTPPERTPDGHFVLYHGTSQASAAKILASKTLLPDDIGAIGFGTTAAAVRVFAHLKAKQGGGKAILRMIVDKDWMAQQSVMREGNHPNLFLIRADRHRQPRPFPQHKLEIVHGIEVIEKFNPAHQPAGTPKGGEFAPKTGGQGVPRGGIAERGRGYTQDVRGVWRDAKGRPASAALLARLKELGITKGYHDVRLHPSKTAPMQAKAIDAKGREKRYYSAQHHESMAAEKFARVRDFHERLPTIRAALKRDLAGDAGPDREAAAALYLIERTGFRVGTDKKTGGDVQAYGATTLRAKHVTIKGDTVSFTFVGKNGKTIRHTLVDAGVAKMLTSRMKSGGRLFDTDDTALRGYLNRNGGAGFKVKDFRTWYATAQALKQLKGARPMRTVREFKARQKHVAAHVASLLGNTPKMALEKYIDPTVWAPLRGW